MGGLLSAVYEGLLGGNGFTVRKMFEDRRHWNNPNFYGEDINITFFESPLNDWVITFGSHNLRLRGDTAEELRTALKVIRQGSHVL